MNLIDRGIVSAADRDLAKPEAKLALAHRQRRRKFAIGVAVIVVIAAAVYYYWATTLCGDCGTPPVPLPPPPA